MYTGCVSQINPTLAKRWNDECQQSKKIVFQPKQKKILTILYSRISDWLLFNFHKIRIYVINNVLELHNNTFSFYPWAYSISFTCLYGALIQSQAVVTQQTFTYDLSYNWNTCQRLFSFAWHYLVAFKRLSLLKISSL